MDKAYLSACLMVLGFVFLIGGLALGAIGTWLYASQADQANNAQPSNCHVGSYTTNFVSCKPVRGCAGTDTTCVATQFNIWYLTSDGTNATVPYSGKSTCDQSGAQILASEFSLKVNSATGANCWYDARNLKTIYFELPVVTPFLAMLIVGMSREPRRPSGRLHSHCLRLF